MSYTTIADLVARFGTHMLVKLAGEVLGEPDPAVLAPVIADVDARIDAYVGVRYRTPLAQVQPVLGRIAAVLVYAELHRGTRPDQVARDAEGALRELRAIASGDLVLQGAEVLSAEAAATEGAQAQGFAAPRVFGRDGTSGYGL